jgi:hypothetical protein
MKSTMKPRTILLATVLACGILVSQVQAQSPAPAGKSSAAPAVPFRNQPPRIADRARMYYGLVWGVESLSVKAVESGEIIRFSWSVLDAEKAKTLNDKELAPVLIDPEAGVELVVPALEQVGSLRQMSTPVAGKSYWMAFSNSGRKVKSGHHVIVQIGHFHADGLIVE